MTNNTSGPGGGNAANNEIADDSEQPNVVAALGLHTNAAIPVASLGLPSGKSQLTNTNSTASSSAEKQSLTRRVRSRSKTDTQSVTDKSLFSRIFSKKSKKPMGTLISTTTKSIDLDINNKGPNFGNKLSLITSEPRSTIDEEEYDYGDDDVLEESNITIGSLSGQSGIEKKYKAPPHSSSLPTSDSQYYASMSSAPTGFSISYHKRMTKGNDDLRLQAALGRLQQQNKKGNPSGGTSQLMVCHTLLYLFLAWYFFFFLSVFFRSFYVFYALWGFIVFT